MTSMIMFTHSQNTSGYYQIIRVLRFMPRLHLQVWHLGTERKACKKALSCCQARAIFCLWRG